MLHSLLGGDTVTVGEKIQQLRQQQSLTQGQLAALSGTALITIHQYESGKRQPRLEQLRRIAEVFGVSVSELVEPEYWSALTEDDKRDAFADDSSLAMKERLTAAFEKLNGVGQREAVKRVEEMAEVRWYLRKLSREADTAAADGNTTAADIAAENGEPPQV